MGLSSKVKVGNKYFLGLHTALCQYPINYLRQIRIQKEMAWSGVVMDGQLKIDKPDLFGGKDSGGGWTGTVDVMGGAPDQAVNAYLATQMGENTPAFRGVVSMAWNKNYIGNAPTLATIAAKVTSVYTSHGSWLPQYEAVPAMGEEESALENKQIYVAIDASYSMFYPWDRMTAAKAAVNSLLESLKGQEPSLRLVTFGNSATALDSIEYTDATDAQIDTIKAWVTAIAAPAGVYSDEGSNFIGAVESAPDFFVGPDITDISSWFSTSSILGGIQSIFSTSPTLEVVGGYTMIIVTDGEANPTSSAADARAIIDSIGNARSFVFQFGNTDTTYSALLANVSGNVVVGGEEEIDLAQNFSVTVASNAEEAAPGRPTPALDEIMLDPDGWEALNLSNISTGEVLGDDYDNHNDSLGRIFIWLDVSSLPDGAQITYRDSLLVRSNTGARSITNSISASSLTEAQYLANADGTVLDSYVVSPFLSSEAGDERSLTVTKPAGAHAIRFETAMTSAYSVLGVYARAVIRRPVLQISGVSYPDVSGIMRAAVWGEHDRNPIHMLRDLAVAPWYGGDGDASVIGDTFATAAAQVYDERLGMTIFHSAPSQKDDFKRLIEEHIDGAMYFDHSTGKWEVKLIRDDFDVGDLFTFDRSIISDWVSVERPIQDELPNQITVKWTQRDGEDGAVTLHNIAAVQQVGGIIPDTREYPGCSVEALAWALCERDLAAATVPLFSGSFRALYVPEGVFPGAAIIVNDDRVGIASKVCRVTELDYGDGVSNEALISFVEDKFSLGDYAIAPPPTTVDPSAALPPNARLVEEAPYYVAARSLGELEITQRLDADPDAGFLMACCDQPNGQHISAYIAKYNGSNWYREGEVDFGAYGLLQDDLSAAADATTFDIPVESQIYEVAANDLLSIGSEIMRVDNISITGDIATVTVGRGCLDTVPVAHSAGDAVLIWGSDYGSDEVEYTSGESVDVKLLPRTGKAVLPPSEAVTDSVTFASRLIRPLPPGKVQLDGAYLSTGTVTGDMTLTWAHRDRLTQTTGSPEDFTDGNVGPEAGVSYTVMKREAYANGTFGTPSTITTTTGTTATVNVDGTYAANVIGVQVGVKSTRDGYDCWQVPWIMTEPAGLVLAITDEAGNVITDEAGNAITDEG